MSIYLYTHSKSEWEIVSNIFSWLSESLDETWKTWEKQEETVCEVTQEVENQWRNDTSNRILLPRLHPVEFDKENREPDTDNHKVKVLYLERIQSIETRCQWIGSTELIKERFFIQDERFFKSPHHPLLGLRSSTLGRNTFEVNEQWTGFDCQKWNDYDDGK